MRNQTSEHGALYCMLEEIMHQHMMQTFLIIMLVLRLTSKKRKRSTRIAPYSLNGRIPTQVEHLHRIIGATYVDCVVNLRMDRNSFGRLCILLRDFGGLRDGKYVSVSEQVAMFLGILAHHKKNRIVRFDFLRSGQTISYYTHVVLQAILKLHGIFFVKPKSITEAETDPRWKCFKGCLGALDGCYINVMVPLADKPRYRTRKRQISTNTLVVCDRQLRFIYVLPGWEGSTADCRVLRDVVNRPNGLKVPKGHYYLCDNGYANSEGFLSPYKGVRYHLKEWGPEAARPQNAEELFNMRHTRARNVIERAFGIMKMRWGILRSATYYPTKVQNRLILACFILHNFIRSQMDVDPVEILFDAVDQEVSHDEHQAEFIDVVESSSEWNSKRDALANLMWLENAGN